MQDEDIKICDKIHEGYHIQAGYDETIKMLKQKDKFDGIFCYNDLIAYGTIKALKEHKIKIPNDVRIVGYDDITFSKLIEPELTTVRVNKTEMGYEAFNMIYKRIKAKRMDNSFVKKILDVELIVRESA